VIACNKKLERLLLTDNGMPSTITSGLVQTVVQNCRPTLKMLQIGGQSKVAPFANAVLPAVHMALVQCLSRNRGELKQTIPSVVDIVKTRTSPERAATAECAPSLPTYAATMQTFPPPHQTPQASKGYARANINSLPSTPAASLQHIVVGQQFHQAFAPTMASPQHQFQVIPAAFHQHQLQQHVYTSFNGTTGAPPTLYATGPPLVSADGLATFSPTEFHSLSAPPGSTVVWYPVVQSENRGQLLQLPPGGAMQCSW
jgi:hypothetical protein